MLPSLPRYFTDSITVRITLATRHQDQRTWYREIVIDVLARSQRATSISEPDRVPDMLWVWSDLILDPLPRQGVILIYRGVN